MNLDWLHIHLMVNHAPVLLAFLGVAASLVAAVSRRESIWRYAAVTLVLAALGAPAALLSGQRAEHEAEEAWYVSGRTVHEHEEAGERALWVSVLAGVAAALVLWRPEPHWRWVMLLLAILAAAAMGYASFEGGKIVHQNPVLETAPSAAPAP